MTPAKRRTLWWSAAIVVALLAIAGLWKVFPVGEWLVGVTTRIGEMGIIGYAVYFGLYVLLAVLSFPTTPLNIGAGVIFGFLFGYPLALAAGGTAAMLTFLFAKYVATDWIQKKLEKFDDFETLTEMVREEGFKMVFLTRLNPFIPATVKNYAFAVSDVRKRTYLLGTVLGQLPIFAVHVYLGWAGGAAMMAGAKPPEGLHLALLAGGVVVSIVMFVVVTWYARRALNQRM